MNMSGVVSAEREALIQSIRRQFDALLEAFPPALHSAFIHSYNRSDHDSPGLLSLVGLPFWLGEKWRIGQDVCRNMAVGNLFLLHCFQSFDFIIDGDRPDTSVRSQVVLGNLCYLQVVRHYRPYFPPNSPFWERMEAYWQEWGESILWEVEKEGARRPFDDAHLQIAAHKAAALKICPTGLALLAGQPELIPVLEQAVDLMHATFQLSDDLQDWREDLQHRRYNAFLSMLAADQEAITGQALTPEDVTTSILDSDILQKYVKTIHDYAGRARTVIDALGVEPWVKLIDCVAENASWMEKQNQQWLEGFLVEQLISTGGADQPS